MDLLFSKINSIGTLPSHAGDGPAYVTVSNLVVGMRYRIVIFGTINLDSAYKADAQ